MTVSKIFLRITGYAMVLASIFDSIMTYKGLKMEIARELNPVLGFLGQKYGITVMVVGKSVTVLVLFLMTDFIMDIVSTRRQKRWMQVMTAFFALACFAYASAGLTWWLLMR